MTTSNTTGCGGDAANRFPKHLWDQQRLSASGQERRSDLSPEMAVLTPEVERQGSVDTMENNFVLEHGPSAFLQRFQMVLRNEQVVSLGSAEHLQADKLRRDHDRMQAVSSYSVDSLKPRKPLAVRAHKANVVAQHRNCTS